MEEGKRNPVRKGGMRRGRDGGRMERKTVPEDLPGSVALVTLSCSTTPRGIQLSPHHQPRQALRPLHVARALMEEGAKKMPEAPWAIQECFLVEVTAMLSKR